MESGKQKQIHVSPKHTVVRFIQRAHATAVLIKITLGYTDPGFTLWHTSNHTSIGEPLNLIDLILRSLPAFTD